MHKWFSFCVETISIHAPLARCDSICRHKGTLHEISIHAPLARCDRGRECDRTTSYNFNPRTSCEVRLLVWALCGHDVKFQSTHLLRGATSSTGEYPPLGIFQSTHLLRGATDGQGVRPGSGCISIHAPLARCDRRGELAFWLQFNFNPRTSCEVRPSAGYTKTTTETIFQSTHLLRGATKDGYILRTSKRFQSTHLLRGATFSIVKNTTVKTFQSTHLLRGATTAWRCDEDRRNISIHAPLARCDRQSGGNGRSVKNFNPRTSCEVRPAAVCYRRRRPFHFNPRTSCEVRLIILCSQT